MRRSKEGKMETKFIIRENFKLQGAERDAVITKKLAEVMKNEGASCVAKKPWEYLQNVESHCSL